jgi:hypothetical protein
MTGRVAAAATRPLADANLRQDLIQQFRVLGKNRQDDLCPIGIGHGVQRIFGVAAMLDVGALWMHIVGGIRGALLGDLARRLPIRSSC